MHGFGGNNRPAARPRHEWKFNITRQAVYTSRDLVERSLRVYTALDVLIA